MKPPFFISNILLLLTVIVILVAQCLCEGSNANNISYPEIESKWQTSIYSGWYLEDRDNFHQGVSFRNDQKDMVLTSTITKVILICSAKYPVYWTYDLPDGEGRTSPSAYLHRTSDDFNNPQTYKFYSYITLSAISGLSTGMFTCRSAREVELQTSRYIYWEGAKETMVYGEGVSGQMLNAFTARQECKTPSCLGLPSKIVQADKGNQTITLPCAVNSPLKKIKLYKKSESTTSGTTTAPIDYREIEWTNATTGITFDPKVGFIINVTEQVTPPYGIYKCTPSTYGTMEVLVVNVTTGLESKTNIENNIRSGDAKYYFDTSTHSKFGDRIMCCSSGTKPPKIYHTFCRTKYECTTARQQLQEFKFIVKTDIRSGHCRSFVIGTINRSPSVPVIGVFRCVGEGIDVTREYYVPPTSNLEKLNTNKTAIYYDDEISGMNKSDLIKFSSGVAAGSVKENQLIVYTNQSVTLSCHPSNYFFILGVRWSIVWQNQTTQLIPGNGVYVIEMPIETELSNELRIKASKDIHSVICHAPLFNSSEWVNQSLHFNVTHPEEPKIQGPTDETITWRIGDTDKELNCEATGVPTPYLTWEEPKMYATRRAYDLNRVMVRVRGEGKTTLKFKQVLSTMGGEYTCSAHSAASLSSLIHTSAVKTFTVKVTLEDTNTTIGGTTTPQPESSSISNIPTLETSTVESGLNNSTTTGHDANVSTLPIASEPNNAGGIGTGMIILICVVALVGAIVCTGFVWRKMKRARGGSSSMSEEDERFNRMS